MCSLLPSKGSRQMVHSSLQTCGGRDGPGSKSTWASRMEMLGIISMESCEAMASSSSGGNMGQIAAEKKPPPHRTKSGAGARSKTESTPDSRRHPTSLRHAPFRRGTWKSLQQSVNMQAAQEVSVSVQKKAHPSHTTGCPRNWPHSPRNHLVATINHFHNTSVRRAMYRHVSPNPNASNQSRKDP